MLDCDFCGCYAPEPAKGWTAVLRNEGADRPWVAIFCPPCAAAEFGYRPNVAAEYVCTFEPPPQPSEPN